MPRVIEICNWRPKQIEAVVFESPRESMDAPEYAVVGAITIHLLADGTRFRTDVLGPILQDTAGRLWVGSSAATVGYEAQTMFLASDVDRLARLAELHVELTRTATLPRSRQQEHVAARDAFEQWIRTNDPQCRADEGSFWNRLQAGDF